MCVGAQWALTSYCGAAWQVQRAHQGRAGVHDRLLRLGQGCRAAGCGLGPVRGAGAPRRMHLQHSLPCPMSQPLVNCLHKQ